MIDPSSLEASLNGAKADHARLVEEAESRVASWAWFAGPRRFHVPYAAEIFGLSPEGKPYEKTPAKPKSGDTAIGQDDAGAPRIVREYTSAKDFREQIFEHEKDRVRGFTYATGGKPLNVTEHRFQGGKLVADALLSPFGATARTYEYDAEGRLTAIVQRQEKRGVYAEAGDPPTETRWTLVCDALGLVRAESREGENPAVTIYERPTRALKTVQAELRERLTRVVPEIVRGARIEGRAFALLLVYDAESSAGFFPPSLAVGLESERARWQASKSSSVEELWIPHAHSTFDSDALEIDDEAVDALSEEMNAYLRTQKTTAKAMKLLLEIAADLGALSWRDVLTTTEDFVVLAVDLEGADIGANAKALLKPKELRALTKAGYL